MSGAYPQGLASLVADDLQGRVLGVAVRPQKHAPPVLIERWDLGGAARDHGRSPKRAVTLVASEQLAAVAAILGQPFPWEIIRRNVLLQGINPLALRGRTFQVGEAVLEGTVSCDPCSKMNQILGPRGYAALLGAAGVCARIVTPGSIRVGDPVRVLPVTVPTSEATPR